MKSFTFVYQFTFLTKEQVFGDKQLDILKKYGTKCAITDFAILLGGFVASNYYTSEGMTRKDRTGRWWTKSPTGVEATRTVDSGGSNDWSNVFSRFCGARPAISYSSIQSISSNVVRSVSGIKEISYG